MNAIKKSHFPEFRKANKRFLEIENDAKGTTASWTTTIPQSRMSTYSGGYWNNTTNNYPYPSYSQNGICGTISSAVMLAYYDDYVNNNYVPASIRTQYSSSPGSLITTLYSYIDALHPNGTLPSHLNAGIYNFLSNHSYVSTGHQSFYSSGATWVTAKNEINAGYPLCIGLVEVLGSTYGNHWVVAYQYLDTGNISTRMYKCVDVIGSYTAAVYVCWSVGEVHMD